MSFRAAAETFLQVDQIVDGHALLVYQENVSAYQRRIPLVLRPRSTSEVQRIIRIAQQLKTPLYPMSCGRNWGMGSRLPVQDGSVVLDLSEMRQIRKMDEEFGTVDLEPGVTQGGRPGRSPIRPPVPTRRARFGHRADDRIICDTVRTIDEKLRLLLRGVAS